MQSLQRWVPQGLKADVAAVLDFWRTRNEQRRWLSAYLKAHAPTPAQRRAQYLDNQRFGLSIDMGLPLASRALDGLSLQQVFAAKAQWHGIRLACRALKIAASSFSYGISGVAIELTGVGLSYAAPMSGNLVAHTAILTAIAPTVLVHKWLGRKFQTPIENRVRDSVIALSQRALTTAAAPAHNRGPSVL